jgi:MFS superfamily sulfate permease-like transporter
VPGLSTLRSHRREKLARDTIAGLVLAAFLVPVGMGYVEASGLPAITGLYATIVPLLVYAIVGPSRILVLGPDSSLAPPGIWSTKTACRSIRASGMPARI